MMANSTAKMIDIVFDLDGETLPASYPFGLWEELLRLAPQLADHENAGVVPLRLALGDGEILLSRRSKLALRLPSAIASQVIAQLTGKTFEVEGRKLRLGKGRERPIQPYPTIHAPMVADSEHEETLFMERIRTRLNELGVSGRLICGRRHMLTGGQQHIEGFSLVIHDLKPEASLTLQYAGLGKARRFGCGIFIPYKVISGLNDD